jgi:hypothetical protein
MSAESFDELRTAPCDKAQDGALRQAQDGALRQAQDGALSKRTLRQAQGACGLMIDP